MPTPRDKGDEKLISDVTEFGWHVVGIQSEGQLPAFAFSVGLFHNYKHPEILTMGLTVETMHQMINAIGEEIRNGKSFQVGSFYEGILCDFDCAFVKISSKYYREHLGYAKWFYDGSDFPAYQCVWPDKQGRFPWDSGFADALCNLQPVLND